METFTYEIPNKLNGFILESEIGDAKVYIVDDKLKIVSSKNKELVDQILANHNPPAPTEPTIKDKLAMVGLTVADLKTALGLA